MHASVDGLGNPRELRITGGEKNDMTQGEEWIESWQKEDTKVIGDKGYDANELIEKIGEAQAVIPPKRNRKTQRYYDKHNLVLPPRLTAFADVPVFAQGCLTRPTESGCRWMRPPPAGHLRLLWGRRLSVMSISAITFGWNGSPGFMV